MTSAFQPAATARTPEAGLVPRIATEVTARPGEALEPRTREVMEERFGFDFGSVRIHRDAQAAHSANMMGLNGYTMGQNIVVAHAQDARLLAHELAHVAGGNEAEAIRVSHELFRSSAPLRVGSSTGLAALQGDSDPASTRVPEVLSVPGAIDAIENAQKIAQTGDRARAGDIADAAARYLRAAVTDTKVLKVFGSLKEALASGAGTTTGAVFLAGQAVGAAESIARKLRMGLRIDTDLTMLRAGERLLYAVERGAATTGATAGDPKSVIKIDAFLRDVQAVEAGYPSDTREQILTRIRQLYYYGQKFEKNVPGAPFNEPDEVRDSRFILGRPRLLSEQKIGKQAYQELSSHADENLIQDNPSPYIELPNGERIDVGHLLLGLDALLHPQQAAPFSTFNVPSIDPASWVADLGIAVVWQERHERGDDPQAPKKPPQAEIEAYYAMSAPQEDLLGDVDSFALHRVLQARPKAKLSEALRLYYVDLKASEKARFQAFCNVHGFTYERNGDAIAWNFNKDPFIARINNFNDLFDAPISQLGGLKAPTHRQWKNTPVVFDKFLVWLKKNLEAELKRSPPK